MVQKELAWVDFLRKNAPKAKDVVYGIGDDCALVKVGTEKVILKSDLFIEGIHFDLKKTSFQTIGMRAVSRVLSDFSACGGWPKYIGVSLGLPKHVREISLKKIFKGVIFCAKKYDFSLVGGDTSRSDKLFLDVWGLGKIGKFISRSGAKAGDYIFLTGPLGVRKFNEPFIPHLDLVQKLVNSFKVNAMIDVSDGFLIDLYRLIDQSKKGALIYKELIPHARDKDLDRGEDYELIFTVSPSEERIDYLKKKFHFLGEIKSRSFGYKMKTKNKISKVNVSGYSHFR